MKEKGEQQGYQDLQQARGLFLDLFADNSTFVNLGYTIQQTPMAKQVLSVIEEDKATVRSVPRLEAHFQDKLMTRSVVISKSNSGYTLVGKVDYRNLILANAGRKLDFIEFAKALSSIAKPTPFDIIDKGVIAEIRILPDTQSLTEDLDELVKNLYGWTQFKDSYSKRKIAIQRKGKTSDILSSVLPIGTYRATWIDERTKLELIVENNFETKGSADAKYLSHNPVIHVWRKISAECLVQNGMIAFGRKPNFSKEKAQEILNAPKERVFSGRLSLQENIYPTTSFTKRLVFKGQLG